MVRRNFYLFRERNVWRMAAEINLYLYFGLGNRYVWYGMADVVCCDVAKLCVAVKHETRDENQTEKEMTIQINSLNKIFTWLQSFIYLSKICTGAVNRKPPSSRPKIIFGCDRTIDETRNVQWRWVGPSSKHIYFDNGHPHTRTHTRTNMGSPKWNNKSWSKVAELRHKLVLCIENVHFVSTKVDGGQCLVVYISHETFCRHHCVRIKYYVCADVRTILMPVVDMHCMRTSIPSHHR